MMDSSVTYSNNLGFSLGKIGTAALRLLPPEFSHDIGLWLMEKGIFNLMPAPQIVSGYDGFNITVPGIGSLAHPIGLAAGFDKNCRVPVAFRKMGLSFIEIGTVTPMPQSGNPKPRMFRYPEYQAIINRMGFNSDGIDLVLKRLSKLNWNHSEVPLGLNVGKNKITSDQLALEDFSLGFDAFSDLSQWMVVNLSSPNTPGLRNLASVDFLTQMASRHRQLLPKIWIKLDPDMSKRKLQELIHTITDLGYQGVILSNTHKVNWPEVGGQSGHPLSSLSTRSLEWAWDVHKGSLPMVASGGVMSGLDVFQRLARGALAVQIYAALVYRGPWVVLEMLAELKAEMELLGISSVQDIVGLHYKDS